MTISKKDQQPLILVPAVFRVSSSLLTFLGEFM